MSARIFQLSCSQGGVPKLAVQSAEVNELGLAADRQRMAKIHGGPDRAVCIFSLEVIQKLQREGHPIYPGSTGENVTISELDWSQLAIGRQLALGNEVLVELTQPTDPCKQIKASFRDGKFMRLNEPGDMRWYCRVLRPGMVRVAMPVRLL
jgi:MOSC domain-containing protein YiiM